MIEVCCRQLIEITGQFSPKPLVAAIALKKDCAPSSLRKIVKLFRSQFIQSSSVDTDEDAERLASQIPPAGTSEGPLPPL